MSVWNQKGNSRSKASAKFPNYVILIHFDVQFEWIVKWSKLCKCFISNLVPAQSHYSDLGPHMLIMFMSVFHSCLNSWLSFSWNTAKNLRSVVTCNIILIKPRYKSMTVCCTMGQCVALPRHSFWMPGLGYWSQVTVCVDFLQVLFVSVWLSSWFSSK